MLTSTTTVQVIDPDSLLDQSRVAEILGTTTKFLEARRVRGGGPPFIRVGRLVRYRRSDVIAWLDSRCCTSTSTPRPAA